MFYKNYENRHENFFGSLPSGVFSDEYTISRIQFGELAFI